MKPRDPDDLLRLIQFCKTVQSADIDPFDLDVKKSLSILKAYIKRWKSIDDLLLDGEAISGLTRVIELQCKWIRDRAASFYIDPALIELKLRFMEPIQLASAFLKAWHPILALDRLTPERLKQGIDYWNALLPLNERMRDLEAEPVPEVGTIELDDLFSLRILTQTEFQEQLVKVQNELEMRGRIEYYDFIYDTDKFEDSVRKAYLTSYLVSEGRAELDIEPLEEKIFITPRQRDGAANRSVPVAISYEDWLEWTRKKRQGRNEK